MTWGIAGTVFALVYLGMLLGRLPLVNLDRAGVALLGALVLVASAEITLEEAVRVVDWPTIALLFAFMVMSAQLRLGGFYARVAGGLVRAGQAPVRLLALSVFAAGALSAIFSNDIICLAMAPVLIEACRQRRLDPVPYLLALACASNIGSAATLIGNPQNMLIGQVLGLSFTGHLALAALPATLGLGVVVCVVAALTRGRWHVPAVASPPAPPPPFDRWETGKGLALTGAVMVCFLATDWPRELVALGAAGLVLTSRRLHSRTMLGLVDWQLLVLFVGLFIINHAFQATGLPGHGVAWLATGGIDLREPSWLFVGVVLLSNAVSNVPAVMLLLPYATHALAGAVLTLASTLAGNLLIVGSIANIIVVEEAGRSGVPIDWRTHARIGVPVTVLTLAMAAIVLWASTLLGA